jgi:hypothetical protein
LDFAFALSTEAFALAALELAFAAASSRFCCLRWSFKSPLLIVPAGCDVAVVGAVGSVGLPDAAKGGGAGTVCDVGGTVCCAITPLANIPQIASVASRMGIGEEFFISNLV